MNVTSETLGVFLLLIPGFVSSLILNAVIVRKPKDSLGLIIEALVFSFFIYVILSPFSQGQIVTLETTQVGQTMNYKILVNSYVLILAAILAIIFPLVLGALITNDFHMVLLRKLRVTARTARHNTWLDVFIDQPRYVVVNMSDGRRIFGWPQYFSNDPDEGLLYLYDAAWVDDEGKYINVGGHGVFIVKRDLIDSIIFTNTNRQSAEAIDNREDKHE